MMYLGCPDYYDNVGRGELTAEQEREILEKHPPFDPLTTRSARSQIRYVPLKEGAMQQILGVLCVLVFSAMVASSTTGLQAQAVHFVITGAGCDLPNAPSNKVSITYWELLNLTEVCVKVETRSTSSTRLYFVAAFEGPPRARRLIHFMIRAHSNTTPAFSPPRFDISADAHRIELIGIQGSYQLLHPCTPAFDCSFDGVISRIAPAELQLLATATTIRGHALGSDFLLPLDSIRAVQEFAATVGISSVTR